MLQHGYKLTSITFSDENNDADYFEDWDNIGINVAKPPNLLKLYKDYGKHFRYIYKILPYTPHTFTKKQIPNSNKILECD